MTDSNCCAESSTPCCKEENANFARMSEMERFLTAEVNEMFLEHISPSDEAKKKIENVRNIFKVCARETLRNIPKSRMSSVFKTEFEKCMMVAIKSICIDDYRSAHIPTEEGSKL